MRFKVLAGSQRAPWQGTVALRAAGASPWLLLNLSGSAVNRLETDPTLARPAGGSSLQPVVLTDAQLDQVAGLISLRGGTIDLYATPSVFEDLSTTMPVLPELQRHCSVHWHMVPVAGDQRVARFSVRGHEALSFTAIDTAQASEPSEAAAAGGPAADASDGLQHTPGHNIALAVQDRASGHRALFVRGLGAMALGMLGALEGVHCLLIDPGGRRDAAAHSALVAWMAALPVPRKVLLGGELAQPQLAAAARIEMAQDGQEIVV